jgi:hypothetical protein
VVRPVERFAPGRLGRSFRWLVSSSWVGSVGDGIALSAGPLLIASETRSAFLVAAAAFLQRLPWLLLGLQAGVIADRVDRRALLVCSETFRAFVIVVLTVGLFAGHVGVWLVLYALHHLHMSKVGYGLLTTSSAVGGMLAIFLYRRLEQRWPLATIMRVCLLLEVCTHLSLALDTKGWIAVIIMFVFGAYAFVWGTVSATVRQRAVPLDLQGRVSSVYLIGLFGGLVLGQIIGGAIAQYWGVVAPFWFAFVGSGLTLLFVWRQLGEIAHAGS